MCVWGVGCESEGEDKHGAEMQLGPSRVRPHLHRVTKESLLRGLAWKGREKGVLERGIARGTKGRPEFYSTEGNREGQRDEWAKSPRTGSPGLCGHGGVFRCDSKSCGKLVSGFG